MKPYGQEGKTKASGIWKKDYHLHDKNHRKLESWWEGFAHFVSRKTIKQRIKKLILNNGHKSIDI